MNFLHFQEVTFSPPRAEFEFYKILFFIQENPGLLAFLSLGILVGSILSLLLTNWSRVMLILSSASLIEKQSLDLKKEWVASRTFLWTVVKISLFTSALMLAAAAVLLAPSVFYVENLAIKSFSWTLGALIFLPLAFTISCLNIFAAFYAVLFKQNFRKALNLATDFFVVHWTKILGLAVILMLIYLAVFVLGLSLIFILKLFIKAVFKILADLGILPFFGMILVVRVISGLVLWLIVAGLNVFFNNALLFLFLELVGLLKTSVQFKNEVHAVDAQPAG